MALFAAAGLFMGGVAMPSAKAADLGGDCCADLEERVAELEATTARKGNRKMSLTITGQVNKVMQYWNDGSNTGAFYGLDNTNSSSRFSFLGEARIAPKTKIGFEIMIETEGPNTSSRAQQTNEDGSFSGTTYMSSQTTLANGTANQSNSDSFFGDARRAAVWIEHSDLGRLTLGRYESAGVVTTIDLGGISVIAGPSLALLNGNFFLRTTDGGITNSVWGTYLDPAAATGRTDLLRYDSPSIGGLVFSASIAEGTTDIENGYWGAMVRYAGEFSGFRVAAGIGYEHIGDRYINPTLTAAPGAVGAGVNNSLIPGTAGASGLSTNEPDITAWGGSLAFLHVPSGLFLQGQYMKSSYDNAGSTTTAYWGETCGAATAGGSQVNAIPAAPPAAANATAPCNPKADATLWSIQGGITKNWFGMGNTALYGEYNRATDWGAEVGGRSTTSSSSPTTNGFTQLRNIQSTETTVWGLGLVQNIDAAATELYIGWRRFSVDLNNTVTCFRPSPGGVIGSGNAVGASPYACQIDDLDVITAGARVKF